MINFTQKREIIFKYFLFGDEYMKVFLVCTKLESNNEEIILDICLNENVARSRRITYFMTESENLIEEFKTIKNHDKKDFLSWVSKKSHTFYVKEMNTLDELPRYEESLKEIGV